MSTVVPRQILKRGQRQKEMVAGGAVQPSLATDESQSENHLAATPSKAKKKKKGGQNARQVPQSENNANSNHNNPVSPLTPPRPSNHLESTNDIQVSPLATAAKPSINGKNKKNSTGNNGQKEHTTTPKPHKNHSPYLQPEQLPSVTPAKAAQMYAGPTFHASPAASSLPMPKFFSKSVPQVNDKQASLQAMMQEEGSEESNSQEDESPTLRNSVLAKEPFAREESPLDIFFKADRAQKAHKKFDDINMSTPNDKFRASSASPARMSPPRHHSRQSTNGAVFPLEMDGDAGKSAPALVETTTTPGSRYRSPTPGSGQTDKDKTEALKQLLFYKTQDTRSPGSYSPSPSPTPPRSVAAFDSPVTNNRSRTASPSPFSSIYSGNLSESKAIPMRPHSSQLRQELSADNVSELPSTPTPSRTQDVFNKNNPIDATSWAAQPARSSSSSSQPKFEAHDALRVSLGNNNPAAHTSVGRALPPDFLRDLLQRHVSSKKNESCSGGFVPLRA